MSVPRWRVLVLPGGTEIGLEIAQALGCLKEVELLSAGSGDGGHAPFAFRSHHQVPSVHQEGWLRRLNELIRAEQVDVVFPAHDDVVLALAEEGDRVEAGVIGSPLRTCRIARLKSETYRALGAVVDCPRVFPSRDSVDAFPVFARPDRSQGSQGAMIVRDELDLEVAWRSGSRLLTEYLPGREYTVDCFSDRRRGLLFAGGRERVRTRAGISMSSEGSAQPVFRSLAERIGSVLELHGPWFFQLKEDGKGVPRLLEVAPRVAGTMALHRAQGVNFPLLALYEREGLPVQVRPLAASARIDRALVNRYRHELRFGTAYVDLDDTLLVRGVVNPRLIAVIYRILGEGRRVVLLTRHAGDLDRTLRRHRLTGVFDDVIHLMDGEPKSNAIREPDALLIDDSFGERMEVAEACGIPTLDCSMLELLEDYRV